jgi:hypothetical protein
MIKEKEKKGNWNIKWKKGLLQIEAGSCFHRMYNISEQQYLGVRLLFLDGRESTL